MSAGAETRVVAVLVSYNRLELLRRAVNSLLNAQVLPQALVVVDNGSTDGAVDYLRELTGQIPDGVGYELVALEQNTGGAGGFTVGLAHALAHHDPDLVWLMDDDTEPHEDTLAEAVTLWESYPAPHRPAFIASRVLWTDGRDHPMNTPRTLKTTVQRTRQARDLGARPVRSASFVSLFVSAQAARREGLPVVDYFLWNDDFEYTARLARRGLGLASDRSAVSHHTKVYDANLLDVGERFRFEVRNKLWLFSRSQALTAGEKVLYFAASLRRWALMIGRSSHRSAVLKAGLRGLREALFTVPREADAALAGVHELPAWKLGGAPEHPESLDFSVLLPVYAGDDAELFRRALASVGREQTRQPAQIVIVVDGAVPGAIESVLREATHSAESGDPEITVVRLPESRGLAGALDAGLEACHYDIVARMDADDISLPERFERQIPYLEAGYDLVGSAIEEIGEDDSKPLAYRPIPTNEGALSANMGFRSPFHHPSVVYRKSAVQAVGGYGDLLRIEDFWLWMRLLHGRFRATNLPQPLVRYRVNAGAYERRGGLDLLKAEFRLQGRLLRSGYISPLVWIRNVAVRCGYRLIPTAVRKAGYRSAFTRKSD
ncbi:glycosyltransferase [Psychromicrobium xiongbiense]|uniref:glycosyltransferase n=1 Tax=Psychromicrobium xiongbiense TaxID=3051184 RepID=UPI00255723AE|nr:glycosyltransferase [Psychromicrobium sp. YIM S02556]